MKYLYLAIVSFVIGVLLAQVTKADEVCTSHVQSANVDEFITVEDEAPKSLKDATILVKLANGKEYSFSANAFKVVKRTKEKVVAKAIVIETLKCSAQYKNRVSVLAGRGIKEGLDVQVNGAQVDASNAVGTIYGLQYQRSLTDKLNVGVQVQSNKTNSLMLGLDF